MSTVDLPGDVSALPSPPSRVQQVYDAIVEDICAGRLKPGTPLRQELLARRFDTSRHPIQQALLLLKNQGMVRDFGRRGLEVTPIDAKFVSQIYGLREVLDGYAARSAAGRLNAETVAQGNAILQAGLQAEQDRDFAKMVAYDVELHQLIVRASGNPLLIESAGVLWRNIARVMSELLFRGGAPSWMWQDHIKIFRAVQSGDADEAERLAKEHAVHGERLILDAIAADSQQSTVDQLPHGPRSAC